MNVHAPSGLVFPDQDELMLRECDADGGYQASHLDAALRFVTNFDCAIDGGAHVGTWSLRMARRFRAVIAVEPSADAFECLERNIHLKRCRNIETRNVALGAQSGQASLVLDPVNRQRKNTGARRLADGQDIEVERIDDWHLESLGFLKLDIEGSEPAALKGAVATLHACRPIVLFENKQLWTKYYGWPANEVERILRACGYRHLADAGGDAIWGPA